MWTRGFVYLPGDGDALSALRISAHLARSVWIAGSTRAIDSRRLDAHHRRGLNATWIFDCDVEHSSGTRIDRRNSNHCQLVQLRVPHCKIMVAVHVCLENSISPSDGDLLCDFVDAAQICERDDGVGVQRNVCAESDLQKDTSGKYSRVSILRMRQFMPRMCHDIESFSK